MWVVVLPVSLLIFLTGGGVGPHFSASELSPRGSGGLLGNLVLISTRYLIGACLSTPGYKFSVVILDARLERMAFSWFELGW